MVLIGALATNFYAKPRYSTQAKFLIADLPVALPDLFEWQGGGIAVHVPSGARLEFMTPSMMNLPTDLAAKIFATAMLRDGLLVASREAIVALNLFKSDNPRSHHECLADVISVLCHGDVNLDGWPLDEGHLALLMHCRQVTIGRINDVGPTPA